ncbi:sigma-54-dependent Fis family transcriptional regulator [candidate division KSB1 bacterium]|nr:sigma-54-dependent Fis family transcriptional regulator [candidate division KSB1 bacterium]
MKKTRDKVVAQSRAMREALAAAGVAALRTDPVLIIGAPGTGKTMLARVIHEEGCPYGPFVMVDCATLTPDVMNTMLYGDRVAHALGRFEMAEEGTLFLSGLENLNPLAQEHIARALETGRYTNHAGDRRAFACRIIATADFAELENLQQAGLFNLDLLRMLSATSLRMPGLADRKEDIPALSVYILDELATREKIERPTVPYHYMDLLTKVTWQENARQLRNHLESVMVLSEGRFDPEVILEHFVTEESPATIKSALQALWRKVFGESRTPVTVGTKA